MDFHLYLKNLAEDKYSLGEELGCILSGGRTLYQLSRSKEERAQLLEIMEAVVRAPQTADSRSKEFLLPGRTYFFLYDVTGEQLYREKMDAYIARLHACPRTPEGIFGCGTADDSRLPWSLLCQMYPFYMEYETRYHNKAEYSGIVKDLIALQPPEEAWTSDTAWYLMTLVETIEGMSKEIFEHYKSLEEIFKRTVRGIVGNGWSREFDRKENAVVGYSVAKACRMGVLNSEKYAKVGLSMADGVIEALSGLKDSEMAGVAMLAYAAHLTLNSK